MLLYIFFLNLNSLQSPPLSTLYSVAEHCYVVLEKLYSLIITYYENNETHLGIKLDQGVLPVALTDHTANIDLPKTIQEVIDQGKSGKILLKELIKNSMENDYLTTEINYAPALMHPEKIICVGLNYQK